MGGSDVLITSVVVVVVVTVVVTVVLNLKIIAKHYIAENLLE